MADTNAALVALLEKKYEFLSTYADISMLWWVSSVVFCATFIGAIWRFKQEVLRLDAAWMHGFFLIVAAFFTSIVIYGVFTVGFALKMHWEVQDIMARLGIATAGTLEYPAVYILVGIGTTSFLLVLIIWIAIWINFVGMRKRLQAQDNG